MTFSASISYLGADVHVYSTHSSKQPVINSIVLFRKPQADSKSDSLVLGKVLSVAKLSDSNMKEYTIGYFAKLPFISKMHQKRCKNFGA